MTDANPARTAGPTHQTESIATASGLKLLIEKRIEPQKIELQLQAQTQKRCVLHWGIRRKNEPGWLLLPPSQWPDGTVAAGTSAMQSPFHGQNGTRRLTIALDRDPALDLVEFVLFFPDEGKWDNNGRRNYKIPLSTSPVLSSLDALRAALESAEVQVERAFELDGAGQLAVGVTRTEKGCRVLMVCNVPEPVALHWGIARRSPHEWLQAPEALWPPGTTLKDGHTTQTPFESRDGLNWLELAFPEPEVPLGIQFVVKRGGDGRWLKHRGGNFYVPLQKPAHAAPPALDTPESVELANRIIQAETAPSSWTLMHRFNLCFDLLERARGNSERLALLYVWLRFSAIRQLTWQRNYNTQPRELAHAQDRLTNRLAEFYRGEPGGRGFLRLMLATLGRGGDGQRIRDEVLQIMHRHHIKEVSGHFMEEWHQKLHNNTTPDDIVICEAYLEFLRTNGNLERFYQTLQQGGVTRERLESFERPIRSSPGFVPHLKGPLIHDFENFLKILKAVHSGTDLETAIQAARERLDGETQGRLWEIWNHRYDPPEALAWLVGQITEVRRRLSHALQHSNGLRELLYLDLALEQSIRVVVERNLHQHLKPEPLAETIGSVLENVTLSYEDAELALCLRHWERLWRTPPEPHFSPAWSFQAKSVVDRIARALSEWTDRLYQLLQPKAEFLGHGFNAESWTITLFSEEVVRGSSLGFALSMLLHQVGRVLRQAANLGTWQIVSRGRGTGQVEVVQELRAVQARLFGQPTVVIADKVLGDEELPKEVVAVIAPDVTDLVSHVAVRARNAEILFASCADEAVLQQLKALRGRRLQLEVTAAGDVTFKEVAQEDAEPEAPRHPRRQPALARPQFSVFAVTLDEFNPKIVGAKSCSQARLRGKLPDWVLQPASMALPFGGMEKVLALAENQSVAARYDELRQQVDKSARLETLPGLRQAIGELNAPEELKQALRQAADKAGISWPQEWEPTWRRIKQVWASQWNERAVLSRQRMGMAHSDLFMSVLIQPVVEADYAFVIHTVNPSTDNPDELYAEVVLGLGETLVGNYPGRALSFTWNKRTEETRLISYPSKSLGLYGGGLIFRSDSNGEDLAGYAGAGLYDSVLLSQPRQRHLDYAEEPLIWDAAFRNGLLLAIARIGVAIETALASAQDIEGAVAQGNYFVVQARPQAGVTAG